ncbi:MAG: hypothetical protein JXA57_16540, partial [Armatimonadetes bacterium]|nr:hypothetical protein [Armatimonadota bacterium]
EEEEKPKALTREAERWTHSAGADYAQAKLNGLILSADGSLSLGAVRTDLGVIAADVVWSLAVQDGAVYVGTGSEGKIFRVSGDGEVSEFFSTGEVGVHALAFSPEGDLYAGTSPRGRLFRISPEGNGKVVFDSESEYIWAIELDGEGTVYAGAGSPGRVYKITAQGEGAVLADLPIANVLSLARTDIGVVFAGTADTGVIYRIEPDGRVSTRAQMPGTSVDALALNTEGELYASSSPDSAVYLIPRDGEPEPYLETGQQMIFGLVLPKNGPLMVATAGRGLVIKAGADGKPELVYRPEKSRFATAIAEEDGAVYVAHSGPCVLRRFGPDRVSAGVIESEVLDAERPAHWGRVRWEADLPEDTSIVVETRSGDSPTPGKYWTPWVETNEDVIMSPPARYLQYRLHLNGGEGDTVPVVRQISVSRRPQNRAPDIALRSPGGGQRLSGKAELKWQGRDPDQDTLVYEIHMSPDLGATWEAVEEGTDEQKYELDTTERDDGRYLLKVTATDRQSAPSDPESADATAVIWIDNATPSLLLFRNSLSVDEERRAHVAGMASDELSPIRSIEYRLGDEDWRTLPLTGVESMLSEVSLVTEPLDPGSHTIVVRAFDAAGNMATDEVEVEVTGELAEEDAQAEAAEAVTSEDAQTPATSTLDDDDEDEGTDVGQAEPSEVTPEDQALEEPDGLAPVPPAPEA